MAMCKVTFALLFTMCLIHCCSSNEAVDKQVFLNSQNKARADVGVRPLVWNKTLATYAQNYANQRKADCAAIHSNTDNDNPYGENIVVGTGVTVAQAVQYWVDEKKDYDYDANQCKAGEDKCFHYTQVVWDVTTQVGCATSRCNNGWVFISCNYFPRGNFEGQWPY